MGQPPLQSSLLGRSILVVADEPFIACCLQMILEAAGAHVRRAADSCDGLRLSDQRELSAAVLDFKEGLGGGIGIAHRLTERGLPFLLYGGHESSRCEAWPDAPLLSRWANGAEIVETLCALVEPARSKHLPSVESAPGARQADRPMQAMVHIESLMRRGSHRAPYRTPVRR
jgi:CheY-like chemotaxis protein